MRHKTDNSEKLLKMSVHIFDNISDSMQAFLQQLGLVFFNEDNVFFVYAPNLDVCGYGLTEKEAQYSFLETFEEFLTFTKQKGTLESELLRLGWEKLPTATPSCHQKATFTLFEPFSRLFDYKELE